MQDEKKVEKNMVVSENDIQKADRRLAGYDQKLREGMTEPFDEARVLGHLIGIVLNLIGEQRILNHRLAQLEKG